MALWRRLRALAVALLPAVLAAGLPAAAGAADAAELAPVPGGAGAWLAPAPPLAGGDPLALAAPAATAVLIYLPGSAAEGTPDVCAPLAPVGGTTPYVVQELAGRSLAGKRLAVFGFCTATKVGSFRRDRYAGTPKVMGRHDDLRRLARAFLARGLPPDNLFLAGHSAGAWAALLLERNDPDALNAVLAFAPAFAGARDTRSPSWRQLRQEMVEYLRRAPRLDSLVFAFAGDPFNRPRDLAFLAGIAGSSLVGLPSDSIDGVACSAATPHRVPFLDCFARTQLDDLEFFLAHRLAGARPGAGGPADNGAADNGAADNGAPDNGAPDNEAADGLDAERGGPPVR